MLTKKILCLVLALLLGLLCLAGCTGGEKDGASSLDDISSDVSSDAASSEESSVVEPSDDSSVNEVVSKPEAKEEEVKFPLRIYTIDLETFDAFLSAPSAEKLRLSAEREFRYTEGEETGYITQDVRCMKIEKEFTDFVCSKQAMEKYLSQNGVKSTVKDVVIFEATNIPITICIITDKGNYYVTVAEPPDWGWDSYVFRSEAEYIKNFKRLEGGLTVMGKDMAIKDPAILYKTTTEIPIVPVFVGFGATVKSVENGVTLLELNGVEYTVDINSKNVCYKATGENVMPMVVGGQHKYRYVKNNELIVDDETVSQIMRVVLKRNISIKVDREKKTVAITEGTPVSPGT